MIKRTHIRERDWRNTCTGGKSCSKGAPSSLQTVTPIAYDVRQVAKCSRMLHSGKT
jgi:hypothetical protein